MTQGKRLLTGHVQYDASLHDGPARDYRLVTLLRDPVSRFVSHYNYLQRQHPDPKRPATLVNFLQTHDAARVASQYLFYFAGVSQSRATDLNAAIDRATANLSRFDLVGDLFEPSNFVRDLRRLTHPPVLNWQRNSAPEPTQVPDDLGARIKIICALEIAIYDAVLTSRAIAA